MIMAFAIMGLIGAISFATAPETAFGATTAMALVIGSVTLEGKDEEMYNAFKSSIQSEVEKFNKGYITEKKLDEVIQLKYKELLDKIPDITKLNTDFAELQKSVDVMAAEGKRAKETHAPKTLHSVVADALKSEDFGKYVASKKSGVKSRFDRAFDGVDYHTKADITPGTATQGVVAPDQMTTIISEPDRRVHIRNFIPVAPTVSNRVIIPVEKTITDGTAVTAEGIQKGVSGFTLDIETFPVMKIASVQKISEEMLDDIPGLVTYITTRFGNKLKNKEDYALLYNTSSSSEFGGLTTLAQAYVDVLADSLVNRWDVLRAAIAQAVTDEYIPTHIFLHPTDVLALRNEKDSTGQYLGNTAPWAGMPLSVDGVLIVQTTAIGVGEFLVGDMAMGAQIFDKMTPSIQFYDQDEDNAQKNLITVVVEERLTLATIRPNAFVYGTFAAAMAQGSA